MNKEEIQAFIMMIDTYKPNSKLVDYPLIQNCINKYVDSKKSQEKNFKGGPFEFLFDKNISGISKFFREAIHIKLKEEQKKFIESRAKIIPINEPKFLIKDVADRLGVTIQNINHHLKKHPEIEVIQQSSRKRYLTESSIEKIKRIGR